MKTIKTTIAIALLFATAIGFANNTSSTLVNGNEVTTISNTEKHQPYFRKSNGKLYLNYLNEGMQNVQIKVIDSNNRIVFATTLKGEFVVEKAFDFNKAVKDNYKVVVKSNKETYYEYITVK
ncbi:MAG: hypothetical protein KJN75_04035 [Muriicola sp.]|nr:hypothetical protein [Muriicola sp.]